MMKNSTKIGQHGQLEYREQKEQIKYRGQMEERERLRLSQMRVFEEKYSAYRWICGVDEAGRGPLAGPVVAAACILPPEVEIFYLNDSKKLSEKKREYLFEEIKAKALYFGIGSASVVDIERLNILGATYKAMREAIANLGVIPEVLLNDAVLIPDLDFAVVQEKIVKGDQKSQSIAAASILAKVSRDRMMKELDMLYPEYGFGKHKGYGTKQHIEAILKFGRCKEHRTKFVDTVMDKRKV